MNNVIQTDGHLSALALGVVGGMGPLAAVKFVEHLLLATPVSNEREHLRILLDNDPRFPDRLQAHQGRGVSPSQAILRSIEGLAALGATAVAIPCNAVHYFRHEIKDDLPIPWLDMIELVAASVSRRMTRPLILGASITVHEKLYSPFLPDCRYPSDQLNLEIFRYIEQLKLTGAAQVPHGGPLLTQLRVALDEQNCDGVLLSCTELSMIANLPDLDPPILDSSCEYARQVCHFMTGRVAQKIEARA